MQKNYFNVANNQLLWFKTKAFKIGSLVFMVIAIGLVVLFSKQIGELLDLWGIRAATEQQTIVLDAIDDSTGTFFFEEGYTVEPSDSFKIDDINNRLILNPS